MKGDYPRFKALYQQEELVEHFHLPALDPKLQLLSGYTKEYSLAIYRDLALSDVAGAEEQARRD